MSRDAHGNDPMFHERDLGASLEGLVDEGVYGRPAASSVLSSAGIAGVPSRGFDPATRRAQNRMTTLYASKGNDRGVVVGRKSSLSCQHT